MESTVFLLLLYRKFVLNPKLLLIIPTLIKFFCLFTDKVADRFEYYAEFLRILRYVRHEEKNVDLYITLSMRNVLLPDVRPEETSMSRRLKKN